MEIECQLAKSEFVFMLLLKKENEYIMTEFDCTEVTLCSGQLIKIQLLTNINVHSFIQVIG